MNYLTKHLLIQSGMEKEKICNAASVTSKNDKGIFREFITPMTNSMGPNDQDNGRLAMITWTRSWASDISA